MNDYMKSLQKHFDRQEHNELDERIRCVREELRQDLGTESRRRLLHLLDAQNTLLVDSTLMSFAAGFKLTWGIATELEADGLYSFEKEDEEPISEVNTHSKETRQRRGQHSQEVRWSLGGPLYRRLPFRNRQADHQKCTRQDAGGMQGKTECRFGIGQEY